MASLFNSLILISSLLLASSQGVSSSVQLVKGLSWSFYEKTCPEAESIVREHLKKVFQDDIGQAAGLLRLHFHDCFVQGYDASVLLDGSASEPSEQDAPPNRNLRRTALKIINDLRDLVERSVSGGPEYEVPLGRRDGLASASINEVTENLPSPAQSASQILAALAKKSFDATNVVALSGAHNIRLGHCGAFTDRLYPTPDPAMDKNFARDLKGVCPTTNSTNTRALDIRLPNRFDNRYFVNLVNRQGLFTSDQDLYEDPTTRDIVTSFAKDLELFFQKFVLAMTKMGQLGVLTGTEGEIRAHCSVRNS
ncbi:hypothetical protein BT93_B1010 [Corymbia citriodora subsp. variegata]|nr:hypothetical protein BT93_B1010 [Corymbia citriodora subsp. variegata]